MQTNHKTSNGVWLIYYKKNSGKTRVPYDEAVEEALCFGWIDSTLNPIDDLCYMQLYMPRKDKSGWSKLNKDRVEKLTNLGLMTVAGQEKIDIAKSNGTWNKLDHVEDFKLPEDLELVLDQNPTALAYYQSLSITNKKYILYNMHNAKLKQTRDKRITEILTSFLENKLPERYTVPRKKQ